MAKDNNQPTLTEEQINAVAELYNSGKYSETIAKIKAFRILWKSETGKDAFILCETAKYSKETEFEYNNLLRTTTECMSSIFGGANGILVHSFSEETSDFSERIARNQQTILRKEKFFRIKSKKQ